MIAGPLKPAEMISDFPRAMSEIRRLFLAIGLTTVLIWATGCAGGLLSTRELGILGGAGLGAVAGGIVGGATGHPGAGAAIGGVLGGVTGGVIGDQLQKQEKRQNELEQQRMEEKFDKCVSEAKREYERTGKKGSYSCQIYP